MEGLSFLKLMELASQFGLPGIVLVLWWLNERSREKVLQSYRKDMQRNDQSRNEMLQSYRKDMDGALKQYHEDVQEIRGMYEHNVSLVRSYESLAKDLKDVVVMNTQAMQRLGDKITTNQFCPHVRLKKDAEGVQV